MSEITRNQAIQIVEDIRTAISAGSVTNTMEAQVLEYCVSVLGRRIVEASLSGHIENLPDVAAFLAGISPSATLKALLEGITDAVEVINANVGNGYVYAGIATPSSTPVSGKVFYLAKQAGQYANFGGLTVTEGVNILKRNGSTWTQEQLLSMADIRKNPLIGYYECDTAGDTSAKTVTAAGYVLPATGGSVKIKMANRNTVANATLNINSTGAKPLYYNGQRAGVGNTWDTNEIIEVFYDGAKYQAYNVAGCNGDGVFDISAYNLTDGQPTPYEDLAAALGPNGDNVPLSLRKGGMSIKFVQSDNTYVQYRLMTDEWSTSTSDWERYNDITTSNQPSSDLDFSDEQGNVLVRFANGHIKTKNFDSSAIKKENLDETLQNELEGHPISTDVALSTDLDFSDEQGNVLVRFANGHIKTKNFNSSNINRYADRPAGGYENFLVQVNTEIANNDSTSGDLQDFINMQSDRCIINLPINYSPNGTPVTLIIACQSSGGQIMSNTTIAVRTIPKPQTLLAEGFAVLQVNGTPGYTDGIETYGGCGTPVFLQSVKEAYKYVTKKYNIRKDGVLLSGWSQGGLKAWQIAANKIVPVKAAALYAPVLDLWKMMYAFADATNRERMCEQFGFIEKEANDYVLDIFSNIYNQGDIVTKPTTYSSKATVPNDYEFAYILNNYEKWLGYDPICWGTSENIVGEQFRYRSWGGTNPNENLCFENMANIVPCPIKIFVGLSDTTVTPNLINWYKMMSDNAGMLCHFRYYLNGTHNFSSDYNNIQVITKYGGIITTNVPSWEGVLFLERFI